MKLGLQYEMQRPVLEQNKLVEETIEQCVLADEVGFDYLWFVEHHFLTTFSMSPCPEILYGALARLTKRIRLGLGVVILPYHHPVRVAERVAFLDHMSGGRVDFGTGRSAPYEQTGMGIDPRQSRDMWEESLEMIPKIWDSELFEWEGRYWNVPPREVLPKPFQQPHPPIWVAALQPSTYELAAQKGIGVLAFGGSAPDVLQPHIEKYKEDIKKANPVGGQVTNEWCNATLGFCGEDNKVARETAVNSIKTFFGPGRPYVQDQVDVYSKLLENWGGIPDHLKLNFDRFIKVDDSQVESTGADLSGGTSVAHALWNQLDADTLCDRGVVIGGDPDSCIAAIKKHEEAGADQLMILIQSETIPHEDVMESIRMFGKYVLPEFKK